MLHVVREPHHVDRAIMPGDKPVQKRPLVSLHLPETYRAVPTCRRQLAAVWRKGQPHHLAFVSGQNHRFGIIFVGGDISHVPQQDQAVITSGRQQSAIRGKGSYIDRRFMTKKRCLRRDLVS